MYFWIGKSGRKVLVLYQCGVVFVIRRKRKKEERKEVYNGVSRQKEHKKED